MADAGYLPAYNFALHHLAISRALFTAGIVSIVYGTVIAVLFLRKAKNQP